ncbi:unnamed protein product [Adineta ricciae]|uniref:NAD(P)(+)--arginine ADP-ribosyltransferase n=3 Tax=Adineta ricciae TaxID=249248 RepID=A0A815AZJ4_ADIRI|nr:unnamed protein product [Adineta ricciae]
MFTNVDECIDFISSIVYEKVFLFVSISVARQLVPLIHDLLQLVYIYVYTTSDVHIHQTTWMKDFPIVRVGNQHELLEQLQRDIKSLQTNASPFSLCWTEAATNHSIQNLNIQHASFQWNQLLLAALRQLPQNDRSKQDIIDECKAQYQNNTSVLKQIEEFEKSYRSELAIWWYTRDCFLYKMINRALRTEDIDIIFKFRFFITDLYNQLSDLHKQSKSERSNLLILYRGQRLTSNELKVLKSNINCIISMNTFLSATTNLDVALMFAGNGSERPLIESVLFQITIDVNQSDQPVADISQLGYMKDEDEVLLSMSMLFRVNVICEVDNSVWKVELLSINETDIELNGYHKYMKKNIEKDSDPLLNFGSLLFQMGLYDKEEKYYLMVLAEGTNECGAVYNNLGVCYYHKRNYRRALDYYNKALNHYAMENLDEDPCCTQTYNNIGLIYKVEGNYKEAQSFYQKALKIHEKNPTKNVIGYVQTLTGLGHIYEAQNAYNQALTLYLQALDIVHTQRPENYFGEGDIHHHIGTIYFVLGRYDESISTLIKALRISQTLLPNNHPVKIGILIDIGLVYGQKAEYDQALNYYRQAHNVLIKQKIVNHIQLATLYNNIGIIYSKKDEYSLALEYHYKSLEIREQFASQCANTIANSCLNISIVYIKMKNYHEGIKLAEKGIATIRQSQCPDHIDLGIFYNNLGTAYQDMRDFKQALHYFQLSLDIKYRYYPSNHSSIGTTLDNISYLYLLTGDISTSLYYQQQALKIFEQSLGINHPTTINCRTYLELLQSFD